MEHPALLDLQKAYKAALDQWIASIRAEENLVLVDPTLAQVDTWEQAHFTEVEARQRTKKAKKDYEDAIRKENFGF